MFINGDVLITSKRVWIWPEIDVTRFTGCKMINIQGNTIENRSKMILFKAKWASSITPIAKISWNMMDWYPFGIEKYIIYINLTVLCDSQIIESTCSFKYKSNPLNFIEMVVLQCKLGVHVSMSCNDYLPFWFRYSVSNINSEHIQ